MRETRAPTAIIVNDEVTVLDRTAAVLADMRFVVVPFESPLDAMQFMSSAERFELLVTDLCMPVIDGWRLTRYVRSMAPRRGSVLHPKILIVSSTFSGPDAEQVSRAAGADLFLSGYDLDAFRAAVSSLTRGRHLHQRPRTLIVSKEDSLTSELLPLFKTAGYQCTSFADASAAARFLDENPTAILVADEDLLLGECLSDAAKRRRVEGLAVVALIDGDGGCSDLPALAQSGASSWIGASSEAPAVLHACLQAHRERSLMHVVDLLEERTHRLRYSEARYRNLFKNAHDMILCVTPDGQFLFANPAWEKITGYSREELSGSSLIDIVDPLHKNTCRAILADALTGTPQESFELLLVSREGHRIEVEGNFRCSYRDGQPDFIHGIMRDVSERKSLQMQLIQAQKLESLGTLAGGVAHDFNNVLTTILGFAELARMDLATDTRPFEYVSTVIEQGQRASEIVSRLLTFSRRRAPERKPIELSVVVRDTIEMLRRTLPANIAIESDISPAPTLVHADATQIQQVMMNLCVNACQAMPDGGTLTVTVSPVRVDGHSLSHTPGMQPGDYLTLSVCDTGTGMSPDVQKRIFEPFFTTKKEGEGTGLGLSIVYGIVTNHNGHITVESQSRAGSRFDVYLPALPVSPRQSEPPSADIPCGTETVLVVEDDRTVLSLGRALLERLGYRVITAANGVEAIGVFEDETPDPPVSLVLSDVVMPKMDGFELCARLAEIAPDVPVLLTSGYSVNGPESLYRFKGFKGFLHKPHDYAHLARAIRSALDSPGSLSPCGDGAARESVERSP